MKLNYLLIFCLIGCSTLPKEKKLERSNPTSYVYNLPLVGLRNVLIDEANKFRSKHLILGYKENDGEPLDTLEIFDVSGNSEDFYLEQETFWSFKSAIYSIEGKPLDYEAGFHLHLEVIDEQRTQVTVYTIKPRIVIGRELLPKGLHFTRNNKYMNVPPSTIEEYEILLQIGKLVGEKDMPQAIYP